MCITKTNSSEKPGGGGGASGGMVAHDLVNGWQVTACRDERSEPPETPPPPGAPKDKVTFQCDHPTRVRIFPVSKNARFTHDMTKFRPVVSRKRFSMHGTRENTGFLGKVFTLT